MKVISDSIKMLACIGLLTGSVSHAQEKFKVCADPLNPPYSTKEQTGYENKIARLFADQLGQELEYYWFPQRIGFIRNTLKAEIENTNQYRCDVVIGVPSGFDFAKTTKPYFHSTYVLLIAKGRGWDDISEASQLAELPLQRQEALKIAMFDRGPGTAWLQRQGLLDQGIPYQSMTGDDKNNAAMQIDKDLRNGVIDMVLLWGPMAGYIISQSPEDSYTMIPMQSVPGLKFDFSMAMAVRYGDNKRKEQLERLIDNNIDQIQAIIKSYNIPLLPIPEHQPRREDDD
ncbi:quinoprotein dehydrogenase-associated putative ABC transporter substrate-binding protein [Methylomarinum sp. Ch1-1]|uniref:Quinoprotein dehydrogenase-associated putative ABC transporter substrate-binding protein n=1 Tax=Methylomarinum roseum TaxID=3067653 RepID=A0AAU7NU00_9GAMM|nr:quinoprotein dehydrogenase-associated putative ABC transporter substrate-binding protein [Methylomarinum sp. Ch1-1]MDP4519499.1 quinoprotein dehydrogenase-associated putative ABC transporter substrate-binding protein [Methylomarinum sp. Ch1-1]